MKTVRPLIFLLLLLHACTPNLHKLPEIQSIEIHQISCGVLTPVGLGDDIEVTSPHRIESSHELSLILNELKNLEKDETSYHRNTRIRAVVMFSNGESENLLYNCTQIQFKGTTHKVSERLIELLS